MDKEQIIKEILYECLIKGESLKGTDTLIFNLRNYAAGKHFWTTGLMINSKLKQARYDLYQILEAESKYYLNNFSKNPI